MDRDAGRGGGEGRGVARAGESTLVHVNGIYIKAAQISSWVLNVRGSKKPFRHAASPLIVKIEGALVLCSCRLWEKGRRGRAGGGGLMASPSEGIVKKPSCFKLKWRMQRRILVFGGSLDLIENSWWGCGHSCGGGSSSFHNSHRLSSPRF